MSEASVAVSTPELETVEASEEELISRAQMAVSQCNWVLGECAASWTQRYARGRTDADFGQMVGLSSDQIYQRRRVWETFGDVYKNYSQLKWSHFYVSLNWDDAPECLQWAVENEATVSEMKAWRRALRGEDLTQEPPLDSFAGDPAASKMVEESRPIQGPEGFDANGSGGTVSERDQDSDQLDAAYAPYRKDAGSPAGSDDESGSKNSPENISSDQMLKRMTRAIERVVSALTDQRLDEMAELPESLRGPFIDTVIDLQDRAKRLGL